MTSRGLPGPKIHAVTFAATLLGVTHARDASAHEVGLSKGVYRLDGVGLSASLTLSQRELHTALSRPMSDPIDPDELGIFAAESVRARRGKKACRTVLRASHADVEDLVLELEFVDCPAGDDADIDLGALFSRLAPGHAQAVFITDASGEREDLARSGRALVLLDGGGGAPRASDSKLAIGWDYLKLGVHHILMGFDHLAFVLGLVLLKARLSDRVAMLTAFSLAHSVTLALSVLEVWAPSPSWVEPLIALSVAFVGVDNFRAPDASKRWRLTAAFGLVHGFGFAGALGELGVPKAHSALGLAAFNLGVEGGQLLVLAVLLPLLWALARRPRVERTTVLALNVGLIGLGLLWFAERLLSAD